MSKAQADARLNEEFGQACAGFFILGMLNLCILGCMNEGQKYNYKGENKQMREQSL